MAVTIRPLPASLGAVVTGLRVGDGLDDVTVALLRRTWLERLVLFFPGLHLTNAEHVALARVFGSGTASTSPTAGEDNRGLRTLADDGHPEILVLDNDNNVADVWHTDVTFSASPPIASLLSMQVSPVGGDTMWINQYRAYDTLAAPVKDMIAGLTAMHGRPPLTGTASHPVVHAHPETGRLCLYVNRGWTSRIEGVSPIESKHLLAMLTEHAERPENTVRWSWTEGDAALWDNRCTQHYAIHDYGDEYRKLHRVTIYA